ncbi:AI-2E family transporter, partial [bacterium]|nr:AI-2E family transporter [bacterium]
MTGKPTRHNKTELVISTRTVVRILMTIVLFVVAIETILILHTQLIWLAISFFLALAVTPATDWLARFMPRKNRGLALFILLLACLLLFIYMIVVLTPPLIEQLSNLVRNFPAYWSNLIESNTAFGSLLRNLNINEVVTNNQDKILGSLSNAGAWLGNIASGVIALITIFTLTFFMVIEGPRWMQVFWRYQNPRRRAARQAIAEEM